MQHARIFSSGQNRPDDKSKKREYNNLSHLAQLNLLKINKLNDSKIFNKNHSNPNFHTMSSHQASLIVGSPSVRSIRSRSSSVHANRSLNNKSSDNTIVVGRHSEKKPDFDTSSGFLKDKRTPSQNDTLEFNPTRDSTIPIQTTIWFHELRTSLEDFLIDLNLLPSFKVGDLVEVEPIENRTKGKNIPKKIIFIIKEQNVLNSASTPLNSSISTPNLGPVPPNSASSAQSPDDFDDISQTNTPILLQNQGFTAPQLSQQILTQDAQNSNLQSALANSQKSKNVLQVSIIANPLQRILDLLPRSLVQVRLIADKKSVEADTIEISIKGLNLSRDSMWIVSTNIVDTCVYVGKRVSYINNRIGVIKNIYKGGVKQFSSYIGKNTKIVYRSEGAKLIFLIQTSREMWHFEENGEIMFHKLVNNLFPKIFKKWREKSAQHAITIVLFTSVDLTDIPWTAIGQGERPNKTREYFRVVVDQVNISHWNTIMENLRLEFANFKRDILMNTVDGKSKTSILEGVSLPAVKGNILEAINTGLNLTRDKFTDTDLKHSLSHLIVITPGTGLFDVDYNLMLETSKKMSSTDCALDIICLSQPPLHIVPLFRFKDLSKDGKISHCVPNWCDISFFKDHSERGQWIPRCKIYELQMMGLMENEVNDTEIERFKLFKNEKTVVEAMDNYDNDIFKPILSSREPVEIKYSFSNSSNGSQTDLKSITTPKGVHDSLLLMKPPKLVPTLSTKVSMTRVNIATTTPIVLGTVSNPNLEGSALSSLYQLKGTSDDKTPILRPGLASPSNSIRSINALIGPSGLRSLRSKSPSMEKILGKLLTKQNDFNKERERSQTSALKRKVQMSTNTIDSNKELDVDTVDDPLSYFWTEISNPSKELHADALSYIKSGKWSQVFPPNIRRKLVKWRSFQSPAALPIYQSMFPTFRSLNENYTTQIYTLVLNTENSLELESNDDLMREMIQLRLLLGFQICDSELLRKVEAEINPGSNTDTLIKHFTTQFINGSKIYMMLDNEIHRLSYEAGSIRVQLYNRIRDAVITQPFKNMNFDVDTHVPLIRTRYADEYTKSKINFIENKPAKYNWNQFDQLIAGYDDALPQEKKSFFKMKFVVMPADIPKNAFFISNEHLTDEEIRVEGLRKLISMIEKGKYVSDIKKEEKDTVSPEINFYTGNLYEYLNEQAEILDITGNKPTNSLIAPEKFQKSIKLINLAHEIQSPTGIKILDRTWHFSVHRNCFVGNEFVSWLLEAFEDISTREDATVFGQSLMDRGLFFHVENRHGFLDGYYFYELAPDYIDKTYKAEKVSWFSRKKMDKDNTSKNNSDSESFKSPNLSPQDLPDLRRIASIGTQLDQSSDKTSTVGSSGSKAQNRRKFILSKAVRYNCDPLNKSYRPEIITVHYDKVHNPEHCYHIRLQWLNTSTAFIDETINTWSRLCERHGLKFVETPWKELCTIPLQNPFHSFVDLKLAVNPMVDPEFAYSNILTSNKFYYHLFLLKKSGFLLDNRSAVYFLKDNIEISYSWGSPSFQYAQFIHKTGSYIVEVRDNGDFFLAPNNMHNIRIDGPVSSNNVDMDYNLNSFSLDSQKVMLGLKKTCTNEKALRRIFHEAKELWREDYMKDIQPTDI